MAGKTITGTVNKTVTLGSGGYLSPLTIASTGEILSSTAGAIGIYLPNQPTLATIVNHGRVYGAIGSIYNYAGSVGGAAIVLDSGVSLTNTDIIAGGAGGSTDTGGSGGDGIDANANVTIVNSGLITGGASAYGRYGTGDGGNGISLATNATLTNSGNIDGGAGGSSYNYVSGTGKGGVGVISSQEAVITNTGNITGGAGGLIGYGTTITGGGGGDGMYISNGTTLTNGGHITGGQGGGGTNVATGGNGYHGIYLGDSTVTNTGTIAGGTGGQGKEGGTGGAGAIAGNYALLSNKGAIVGGAGGIGASSGGFAGRGQNGVIMIGYATVNNTGHITGGAGGNESFLYASGGSGNSGVYLDSGLLTNSGTISGGAGGSAFGDGRVSYTNTIGLSTGYGGIGVEMFNFFSGATRLSVVNYGLIQGGNGGYLSGYGGVASDGGEGVNVVGGTLTNKGAIIGGTGGDTGQNAANYGNGGVAGNGGIGAFVYVGSRLINTGKITGGTGGATILGGTIGGAGVEIGGGTLVTSGTITGGAGGVSQGHGVQGDAVYVYGSVAGTLIINPGAVFHGSVVAVPTVENVLEFAGSSTGTVQGIGTEFTGFYEISFASGATRAIEGKVSAFRNVTGFAPHDSIILDGYTDNLAATTISTSLIALSTSGTTSNIFLQPGQANNFIITDAGSKTTIAPVFGTFSHTLAAGSEQYVLNGSTSTSLLKTGGVEEIYSGGIASKTTIAGGELEVQIGGKIASGVTFTTVTGGELKLDSSIMPTATISGFIAGDTIDLAGIIYNKYDAVTVGTAGIVSIVTPGKTYNLDIAGATVGEKDFVFGAGALLTKKTAAAVVPKMQFIAPGTNAQVSSYWLDAPTEIAAPAAAEPVAAYTTIAAPSTGVGFTNLHDTLLHVSLVSWLPHG
jgi:autotransporter family porin